MPRPIARRESGEVFRACDDAGSRRAAGVAASDRPEDRPSARRTASHRHPSTERTSRAPGLGRSGCPVDGARVRRPQATACPSSRRIASCGEFAACDRRRRRSKAARDGRAPPGKLHLGSLASRYLVAAPMPWSSRGRGLGLGRGRGRGRGLGRGQGRATSHPAPGACRPARAAGVAARFVRAASSDWPRAFARSGGTAFPIISRRSERLPTN